MGNTNKPVIPKLRAGQYFFLFHIRSYLKISLISNKFLKQKRTLLLLKNRDAKNFKIKYQQRAVKLTCSIDKKDKLHKILLSSTLPNKSYYWKIFSPIFNKILEQNCPDKPVFNNVNRLNHSSPMNNTITNKIFSYSLWAHKYF